MQQNNLENANGLNRTKMYVYMFTVALKLLNQFK